MKWLGQQINKQIEPHLSTIPEGQWLEVEFLVRMLVYRNGKDLEVESGYVIPYQPTWWDDLKRKWLKRVFRHHDKRRTAKANR